MKATVMKTAGSALHGGFWKVLKANTAEIPTEYI